MFEPHIRISHINTNVHYVAFRARVTVLLKVPTQRRIHSAYNMHMVLMDAFGDEIHATIYGPAVTFFARYVHEGYVYDFACFQVVKAEGGFRLTSHPFKLLFLFSTLFERASSIYFPVRKFNHDSVDDISSSKDKIYQLQDFLGVVTAVSREAYHNVQGQRTLAVGIELCNEYGTFDCVLLGGFVYDFRHGIGSGSHPHNILFLKLGKGQIIHGRVVCSSVTYVSKVMVNPNMPEIIQFRKRMLLCGFCRSPLIVSYIGSKSSIENQLMGDFPPLSLGILKSVDKPGYYTVVCNVFGISSAIPWYYHECPCKPIIYDISYRSSCSFCGASMCNAIQRFKIPMVCYDSTSTVTLFLLDRDARMLLKRSCSQGLCEATFPSLFSGLVGCQYAFKVEVSRVSPESTEMQFYITRVGHDIINLKSIAPKDESTTPLLVYNANVNVGKGKSAFVPYSSNIKRTHVRRNLNKEYDVMIKSGASDSANTSDTQLSVADGRSKSLDLKKTTTSQCDESSGGS
ncbi:hypothetical protein RIF29_15086 [Crotalaria pallida]|uniref:Replication protein A 70 kDa DNA-binding subunit B/D first OB fold domain-containing protein n=1 Tax=Crotalaria pallida TaxID=3830 RepID=A0AAN9IIX4_CROPI